jgi:hypothetical protein
MSRAIAETPQAAATLRDVTAERSWTAEALAARQASSLYPLNSA